MGIGLGFADRGSLGLQYGYSLNDGELCDATDYQGILGACGWWTTYDERISGNPSANGYDYVYQGQSGSRYMLDTDGHGQIVGGAPVLINRPRHSLLDDNEAPAAAVAAVTGGVAGFTPFSGTYANRTSSGTSISTGLVDTVNLNTHKMLRFAMRTSAAASAGLCLKVHNVTDTITYPDRWWCYTVGSAWNTGFPEEDLGLQSGVASLSAGWNYYSQDMWADIRSDGSFGPATDDFQVIAVNIQSNGGTGYTYLDAVRFEANETVILDDTNPSDWTSGQSLTSAITPPATDPPVSGTKVIRVNAPSLVTCRTSNSCWSASSGDLQSYAFAHWSWKKVGGTTAGMVFYVRDQRAGAPCSAGDCSITYYAGEAPPTFGTGLAIQVSPTMPAEWTVVRRNVLEDARTALGLFDDAGSGSGDPIKMTGFGPVAVDGSHLLVDHFTYGNLADVATVDPTGQPSAKDHPSSAGDATVVWDYTADYPDGSRHYFNRDGLLFLVRDLDGNALKVDWDITAGPTTGPASYRLAKVRAPTDGTAVSGGTLEREFEFSTGTDGSLRTVRVDEDLGTTAPDVSSRAAVFELTAVAESDLVKVSSARHIVGAGATGTFCGAAPSGCVQFTYADTTNHRLEYVADPRWDGGSGSSDYRFQITRDANFDPRTIKDRSHGSGGTALLNVLTYADTRDSGLDYARVQYQDAASGASADAIAVDLSPDGRLLTGYAPRDCGGTCSSTVLPAYTDQADYKTVRHQFDGLARVNTVRTYRCPAVAMGGCAGTTELVSVTREARNAGAKVDNYADPLASTEVAWRQTADQAFASIKDSAGGNPDLYRTSYRYDGRHRVVHTQEPVQLKDSVYPTVIPNTPNVTAWWRLEETSGNALSSVGSYPGTVTGTTRNHPGALQRPTGKAYAFDGSDDRISAALNVGQGAYTLEAWARPADPSPAGEAIAGDYAAATGGAMLWIDGGGRYTLVHTATSTNYLTAGPKASMNRWDHVVGTWDGVELRLYVNGELVGQKAMTTAPGSGASTFEIGAAANATAYHFEGRIDEVGVYSQAISSDDVRVHHRAGLAIAAIDTRTIRDRAGRVLETSDQFVANGGLEAGLAGWADTGTSSTTAAAARSGGRGASIPAGQSITQRLSFAPGQAVRLQYHQSGTGAGLTAKVERWDGSGWVAILTDPNTSTIWAGHAWDVHVPVDGDGRLKFTFTATGSGTAYVDDVVVLSRWTTSSYQTTGVAIGLPLSIATLLPGCADCTQGSITASLSYQAGSSPDFHPAIFPTTTVANDVAIVTDTSTQDVTSTRVFDPWGRVISATDPDGVSATTTYAANRTDVANTADDPGNGAATTTFSYDLVGNRLTTTTPLGRVTSATYDALNRALTTTGPDDVVARTDVNNYGQATEAWANYQNGTAGDAGGADDLLTTTTFDPFGRISRTDADCGATAGVPSCASGLDALTSATYDLAGNTVTSTATPGSGGTGTPRTTTAWFETYMPGTGPFNGATLTRLTPTGTTLAIAPMAAPAPLCPGSATVRCNTLTTVDLAGRPIESIDAYGVKTTFDLDLDGRVVRTTLNDTAGDLHGTANDQNLVTVTRYDLLGRTERTTTVIDGGAGDRWTRTTYDPLGRVTETFTGSGSVSLLDRSSIRTRYTAGGRVERGSSSEIATALDSARTWTRTEYDDDGRAVRTVENAELSGFTRSFVDHMEGEAVPEWSTSATGWFTASAASEGPAFDVQATIVSAFNGRHRLRAKPSTSAAYSGVWRDYAGRTFQAGRTYRLRAQVYVATGTTLRAFLGVDASGGSYVEVDGSPAAGLQPISGTSAWQPISVDWTPSTAASSNVHFAIRKDTAGGSSFYVDDVLLYDTGMPDRDIAVDTVYDLDGRFIASVLPPGDLATDRPMTTTSAYDARDRSVMTSTNAQEPYAPAVRATTGQLAFWPLDEAGGATIDDRNNLSDLTAAGGFALGVAGGIDEARTAIRLNGTNGHASRSSAPTTAVDNFALEAWFRYDAVPTATQVLVHNGTSTTGWGIGMNGGELQAIYGNATWLDTDLIPKAGTWHHVVLTRSGGAATVYLDGVADTPTNSTATPVAPGANFSIGRQDATAGRYFKGDIDEVAVYTAAMPGSTVTAHYAAGRQASTTDGLTTRTVYDALGRSIDVIDPTGVRTRNDYDRLGGLVEVTQNHVDGYNPSVDTELGATDIASAFGRNVLGELIGYCSGKNIRDALASGPAFCEPDQPSNTWSWHYDYDLLGRLTSQVPPTNQTITTLAPSEWVYEPGGRLEKVCEDAAAGVCTTPSRRVEFDQDALGRTTVSRAIKGAQTITTATTYGLDGQPTTVGDGSSTLTFTYDPASGLPNEVKTGATVLTDYAWLPDDTLTSRADYGFGTTTFAYDWAKRLTSLTPPASKGYGTTPGAMTQTWRNDGTLKAKTWPNSETATLGYDTARRPTAINLTSARSLTRTYDRVGNVKSDTRDLGVAVTGTAGHGALTYAYDALGRIIETKLDGVTTNTYTYDRSSNRRSKTDGADSYTYLFDRTDTLKSQAKNGGGASAFIYDAAGNLTTERTATTSRTHTYDAANRLTRILPSTGDDADLTYDPLGRIATRQVGANPVQTFRYVGASDLVWQQASSATTTSSIVDPGGARVGSTDGTTSGGAWLLFDLLGSVAGAESGASGAGSAVTTALRYDAFGQTIGTYPSTGSSLAVRYRGLVDLAPTADLDVAGTGSDPLYAMGARMYAPHLGAFTSFDTYAGEAQDPASMNRYLYAHANPATLIDPTGHRICEFDCVGNATPAELEHSQEVAAETGSASGGTSNSTGTDPGTTSTGPTGPSSTTPELTAGGADPPLAGTPIDRVFSAYGIELARLRAQCRQNEQADCWEATRSYLATAALATDLAGYAVGDDEGVRANAKRGADWQDTVRRKLETRYDPAKYDLIENHALKNLRGKIVRINGKYVRPDFQVVERATRRIVAIYEAKTGTTTYLAQKGAAVVGRYQKFAARLGYAAPKVHAEFQVRSQTNPALRGMARAVPILFIIDLVIHAENGGPTIEFPGTSSWMEPAG